MEPYGSDIFTEPDPDPDTLANLGPLRPLAGVWESVRGLDDHPIGPGSDTDGTLIEGGLRNEYVERYELQPIDPQTNGPQLLYGLRYHVHIVKPGEVETFHDQVGYWLWEAATQDRHPHARHSPRAGVARFGARPSPMRKRSRSSRRSGPRPTASCRARSSITRSGR